MIITGKFKRKPVVVSAIRCREETEIVTLEGIMTAMPGDWIVTGIQEELYPVKDDIFRETYQPVDDNAQKLWKENITEEE